MTLRHLLPWLTLCLVGAVVLAAVDAGAVAGPPVIPPLVTPPPAEPPPVELPPVDERSTTPAPAEPVGTVPLEALIEPVQSSKSPMDLFLPVGLTIAGAFHDGSSFLLGGELSLVAIDASMHDVTYWWGGYLEGVYDFGLGVTRLSIGPELGWLVFGLDAGYLVTLDGDGVAEQGFTVRGMLSFVAVHLYGRYGWLQEIGSFGEVGLLIKFPIPLGKGVF